MEVLLAVVIATLVLGAALGTFRRVVQSRETLRYYSELAAHGRYGLNWIRDDLANIYRSREPVQMRLLGIAGGSEAGDRLILYVVCDGATGGDEGESPSDIFEVEYGLIYDEENQCRCLTRRWAALEEPREGREGGKLVKVARYVRDLQFDYFDGETWQREWREPGRFPQKVEVTLELGDDVQGKERGLLISQVISLARRGVETW
ncbi:MAG: hypothetical protein AMJ79_07580 [Phycisphaerae bacterium SM23_30]|nr:MAG: hypothetical protein AMJ79_07580 [Phycisphaerae bacterium SM23_30]